MQPGRIRLHSFQFTPLREGRRAMARRTCAKSHFNSRPSARGDKFSRWYCLLCDISIHAPPRGATAMSALQSRTGKHFNSRPSARGDPSRVHLPQDRNTFQFTPLREGRQEHENSPNLRSNFNSRPSARGDERCEGIQFRHGYFNSRPSARGDSMSSSSPSSVSDFNSRPSARGDFEVEICPFEAVQFQFTPLREGRLVHGVCWGYWNLISIHAPPRGATKRAGAVFHAGRDFNSRPSARGDAFAR